MLRVSVINKFCIYGQTVNYPQHNLHNSPVWTPYITQSWVLYLSLHLFFSITSTDTILPICTYIYMGCMFCVYCIWNICTSATRQMKTPEIQDRLRQTSGYVQVHFWQSHYCTSEWIVSCYIRPALCECIEYMLPGFSMCLTACGRMFVQVIYNLPICENVLAAAVWWSW